MLEKYNDKELLSAQLGFSFDGGGVNEDAVSSQNNGNNPATLELMYKYR